MTEQNSTTQIKCRVCGVTQDLERFPKMPTGKYGRTTRCKPCTAIYIKQYQHANKERLQAHLKQYYQDNKELYREAGKANYEKTKDAAKARAAKWAEENKEKRKEIRLKWDRAHREKKAADGKKHREENPGLYRAHGRKRELRKRNAMPAWADEAAIRAIYDECSRISKETGVKHHVDHYYPLKNDLVCGLHVHHNLRIITALENLSKGNQIPTEES
jgi:site-specific DNA-cytosine methylase